MDLSPVLPHPSRTSLKKGRKTSISSREKLKGTSIFKSLTSVFQVPTHPSLILCPPSPPSRRTRWSGAPEKPLKSLSAVTHSPPNSLLCEHTSGLVPALLQTLHGLPISVCTGSTCSIWFPGPCDTALPALPESSTSPPSGSSSSVTPRVGLRTIILETSVWQS